MRNQTRQQRRARSITYMAMKTDRLRSEEASKSVTVPIPDIVDMILEHRGRFVQESPVLTDIRVDVLREGVFASQEGAEGMMEIQIGKFLRVAISASSTARATYFERMLTLFCMGRVTLKRVLLPRAKVVACPNILPLHLIFSITG